MSDPQQRQKPPIPPKNYRLLVDAFARHPGKWKAVSEMAGVNPRTARKAWDKGLNWPGWTTPLRELVKETDVNAQVVDRLVERAGADAHGTKLNEQVIKDRVLAMVELKLGEIDQVILGRKSMAAAEEVVAIMAEPVKALAARLAKTMNEVATAKDFDVGEATAYINSWTRLQQTVATIAQRRTETSTLIIDDLRTSIAGGDFADPDDADKGDSMSDEELLADYERSKADLEREVLRMRTRVSGIGSDDDGARTPAATPPSESAPDATATTMDSDLTEAGEDPPQGQGASAHGEDTTDDGTDDLGDGEADPAGDG